MNVVGEIGPLETTRKFNLAIVGLGYEQRGIHCVKELGIEAEHGIALTFGYAETLSFEDNAKYFKERGYDPWLGTEPDAQSRLIEYIIALQREAGDTFRVFVDISVMSRQMMATVLRALWTSVGTNRIEVYSSYAPSAFQAPGEPSPLRRSEPVTPEFSGWTSRPDAPLSCFIGLGYESGLAIGALQYLDPSKVWAFFPVGNDPRFLEVVETVNQPIFDHFNVLRMEYEVNDAYRLRRRLLELSRNILPRSRLILIPFGPKIFAWCAMLVASEMGMTDLSVWRFSAQEDTLPVDRTAQGPIVQFNFSLSNGSL